MKVLLSLGLVLLLGGVCSAEMVSVALEKAQVRNKPAVSGAQVVFEASRYSPLEVQQRQGNYLQVKDYRGNSGWVHKTLVSSAAAGVVTGIGVNVRKGPGKEFPASFQMQKGDTFLVLNQEGDWVEIWQEGGRSGWIWKGLAWGV